MDNQQQYQQARMARDKRFDGQFFVAVKTTGIFCRPICPAPTPKEQNVEYYPLAELAMQAGFRPCIRCRPDSAPQSFAWKGTATTLERGLKLIREYPELPVSTIAAKLGIGERYFRQLFQQQLGISPKPFQLFQRLLFAKQLLQQSGLNIEQVAQACGFSSSRALQQNMQKHLRLTPSSLRTNQAESQQLQLQLAFRPPYNWPQVRDFLRVRAVAGMESVNDDSYARTCTFNGSQAWFEARYCGDHFMLTIELDDITQLNGLLQQIKRVLDVDTDSQLLAERLRSAGFKAEQIVSGLRLPGVFSPFEAACRAVLGQQISVTAAIKMLTTLVHQLGQKTSHGYIFPAPADVAKDELIFLKMPDSRRQTLRNLAAYVAENPDADVDQWLQLKGIGPWTINYVKMRGLSEPDVWLDSDLVIKKQLALHAIDADKMRPWRSYLTFQLWSMA